MLTEDVDENVTVPENTVDEDITLGTLVRYVADNIEGVIDPAGRDNAPVNVNPLLAVKSPEKLVAGNVLGTLVRYVDANIELVIDPAGRVKVPDVNVKPLFAFKSPEKVVAGNVEGTLVRYVCDNIAGVILVGDN
jgi:hypothetical protein